MKPYEIEELKKQCVDSILALPDADIADAASAYLQYGMLINDKLDSLDTTDEDFYHLLFYNATHGWVKYLNEEIGKPVVFDFDLWADTLKFSTGLLEALHEDVSRLTPLLETCQGIMVAMFRIWYEDITVQNILDFFQNKPCPELPDMSDMRKTFLWAMNNDIPCHDMTSFYKYNEEKIDNETADEEIEGYMNMAKLRDMFDKFNDTFVTMGIPKEYLDENRLQLREVYFAAVSFYEMLPPHCDIDYMVDEEPEKIQRFYEKFLCLYRFPGIDLDNLEDRDDDLKYYYYIIFVFGIQTGAAAYDLDSENGTKDASLFKEALEYQINKDN